MKPQQVLHTGEIGPEKEPKSPEFEKETNLRAQIIRNQLHEFMKER